MNNQVRKYRAWIFFLAVLCISLAQAVAQTYPNEVFIRSGRFYWKINNVELGSSTSLREAIQNAMGNHELHITCSGTLDGTVTLAGGVRMYAHNNTFTGGSFQREGSGDISLNDFTLNNPVGGYGIRLSRASNLRFVNIRINGGHIGIRVDSHPSRPYEDGRWVFDVHFENCRFEGCGSHGIETYGVDRCYVNGIVARNCGESGVLLNKTKNGTIGTVDAYRCSFDGGYAGLRFANNCSDCTVQSLKAVECGRGFFTVSGCTNIVVSQVYIRNCTGQPILLQNSNGVRINGGTYNGDANNHYTSVNCTISATKVPDFQSGKTYRIVARQSGKVMDASGAGTANGTQIIQWTYGGGNNQKWTLTDRGSGQFSFTGVQSGKAIDINAASTANGAKVQLWSWLNGNNQKFTITSAGGTYYRITPVHASGSCLEIAGASTANGANVQLWQWLNSNSQKWAFEEQ